MEVYMTCIVGLVSKGKVYIGADSLGSDGFTQQVRKESKVFKNGDFLIGCTSSFRMIDILKWKFNPPTVKDDNLHKFMVTEFVDAVRTLFVENGYNITSDDWRSGCFLVGIRGKLFSIESDFQVYEQDFYAVGSGAYHALGSLYTSKRNSPIKDIEKDVEYRHDQVYDPLGLDVDISLNSAGDHKERSGKDERCRQSGLPFRKRGTLVHYRCCYLRSKHRF